MPGPRRLSAVAAGAALVAAPLVAGATPATADHTAVPARVTLMGSLMSELGCECDWSETCSLTDLLPVPGSAEPVRRDVHRSRRATRLEPFDYLYKVRLNGSWTENYGDATFGLPDGNIPLAIDQDTELRFTYDHATHRVTVGPAQPAGGLTAADRALAGDSLREDLTRENFYFVMADRFENGDSAQRHRPPSRAPGSTTGTTRRVRPSTTAATCRGSSSASTTSRAWARRRSG